jgi:hypothetical protein
MRGGTSYDALSFAVLIGNVHQNKNTHQLKTIKGMGWPTKLLQNNYWYGASLGGSKTS